MWIPDTEWETKTYLLLYLEIINSRRKNNMVQGEIKLVLVNFLNKPVPKKRAPSTHTGNE